MAHICGLGYLADPDHARRTLDMIWTQNRRVGLHDHFNNMRSFVQPGETALPMATCPGNGRRFRARTSPKS